MAMVCIMPRFTWKDHKLSSDRLPTSFWSPLKYLSSRLHPGQSGLYKARFTVVFGSLHKAISRKQSSITRCSGWHRGHTGHLHNRSMPICERHWRLENVQLKAMMDSQTAASNDGHDPGDSYLEDADYGISEDIVRRTSVFH